MSYHARYEMAIGDLFPNEEFNFTEEYFELIRLWDEHNINPLFDLGYEILNGNPAARRIQELLSKACNIDRESRGIQTIQNQLLEIARMLERSGFKVNVGTQTVGTREAEKPRGKYNLDGIRKYLTREVSDEELIKGLEAIEDANLPPFSLSGVYQIPIGARLAELQREVEDARHREILDAISQLGEEKKQQGGAGEDTRQRGKSGRPKFAEDVWAWEQVNKYKRPMNEVKKEWLEKIKANPKRDNMVDPKRQFNRITKPGWENTSGQNI